MVRFGLESGVGCRIVSLVHKGCTLGSVETELAEIPQDLDSLTPVEIKLMKMGLRLLEGSFNTFKWQGMCCREGWSRSAGGRAT